MFFPELYWVTKKPTIEYGTVANRTKPNPWSPKTLGAPEGRSDWFIESITHCWCSCRCSSLGCLAIWCHPRSRIGRGGRNEFALNHDHGGKNIGYPLRSLIRQSKDYCWRLQNPLKSTCFGAKYTSLYIYLISQLTFRKFGPSSQILSSPNNKIVIFPTFFGWLTEKNLGATKKNATFISCMDGAQQGFDETIFPELHFLLLIEILLEFFR